VPFRFWPLYTSLAIGLSVHTSELDPVIASVPLHPPTQTVRHKLHLLEGHRIRDRHRPRRAAEDTHHPLPRVIEGTVRIGPVRQHIVPRSIPPGRRLASGIKARSRYW
jgi:hypothetical protein